MPFIVVFQILIMWGELPFLFLLLALVKGMPIPKAKPIIASVYSCLGLFHKYLLCGLIRCSEQTLGLNIFFTLFLGLLAIIGYEQCKNKGIGILLVASLALTADFFKTDYGYFGVLMIFIFHIFKEKKWLMNLSYIGLCLVKYIPLALTTRLYFEYGLLCACTILPLILIHFYNGEKGPNMKYALYTFYPVHLILLYVFHTLFIV